MPAEPTALDVRAAAPGVWSRGGQFALMALIVLIGGLTPVAARFALREMPPFSTGAVRFGLAGACLLLTTLFIGRRDPRAGRRIERADLPRFLACAVLCVPINQATYLSGVKLAGAAHSGLLYALNPVLVFLITLIFGTVKASGRMALAAIFAFTGAAVIGLDSLQATSGPSIAGDALLFVAVLTWATYSVLVGPLGEKYGPLRTLTIIITSGAILYSPALLIDGRELNFGGLTPAAWAGFLYISLLTSFLSYLLWLFVLMKLSVNRLAVAMNASPLVAVIGANQLCGEPITRWLAVGAGMILLAITLANWNAVRDLLRARSGRASGP